MKLTRDDIINRVDVKFPNTYSFKDTVFSESLYDNITVECKEHGFFETTASSLLYYKTKKCCFKKGYNIDYSKTWNIVKESDFKKFKFLEKSNEAHNSFFDYSEFKYEGNKVKGKIICPDHGDFWQTPNDHMAGHGCHKCSVANSFNYNGRNARDRKTFLVDLYFVNMFDDKESFNKIGISKETSKRLSSLKTKSKYEINPLMIIPITLEEAFEIETSIKKDKSLKYTPLREFPGHTECVMKGKESFVINKIGEIMEERFDKSKLVKDILNWDYNRKKKIIKT